MMKLVSYFVDKSAQAVTANVSVEDISTLEVMWRLRRMGEDIGNDQLEKYDALRVELDVELAQLTQRTASDAR
jgi:V/A-type H+-transporting ATPase subunit A